MPGGTSGKIGFPEHMEETHFTWMGHSGSSGDPQSIDVTLPDVMNSALGTGGNPWESHSITDPASDIADIKNRYDSVESSVDNLDKEADWKSIVDSAVQKVDEAGVLNEVDMSPLVDAARSSANTAIEKAIDNALKVIDGDIVESVVDQFEKKSNKQKNKILNRFNATMADVNAVQSSAYIFGMAIIEAEHLQQVDEFQSKTKLQLLSQNLQTFAQIYSNEIQSRLRAEILNKSNRDQLIESASQLMARMLIQNNQLKTWSVESLRDIKRIDIMATQEFEIKDADLDYKFARWDFEVFTNGVQALGGIGQGTYKPPEPSRVMSNIGFALSATASLAETVSTASTIGGAGG